MTKECKTYRINRIYSLSRWREIWAVHNLSYYWFRTCNKNTVGMEFSLFYLKLILHVRALCDPHHFDRDVSQDIKSGLQIVISVGLMGVMSFARQCTIPVVYGELFQRRLQVSNFYVAPTNDGMSKQISNLLVIQGKNISINNKREKNVGLGICIVIAEMWGRWLFYWLMKMVCNRVN